MSEAHQCAYGDFAGFDNRSFRIGQRVCVRRDDGTDDFGIFRGVAPQHAYRPGDAMAPGMDEEVNGYLISGIAPNKNMEHVIPFADVGTLRVKKTSETATRKIAEAKNLPEDIERSINKFGGKKSRRPRRKNRKTRRR